MAVSGESLNVNIQKIPQGKTAPPIIRRADMRPSTFMVLGKRTPNSIVIGRVPRIDDTDSMMPHFGITRNSVGFLSNLDPQVNTKTKLMKRPHSAIPFKFTDIPEK